MRSLLHLGTWIIYFRGLCKHAWWNLVSRQILFKFLRWILRELQFLTKINKTGKHNWTTSYNMHYISPIDCMEYILLIYIFKNTKLFQGNILFVAWCLLNWNINQHVKSKLWQLVKMILKIWPFRKHQNAVTILIWFKWRTSIFLNMLSY